MNPPPDPVFPTALRLTSADFDACAAGGADRVAPLSQPRQELEGRMLRWAHGVVGRLAEIGILVDAVAEQGPNLSPGGSRRRRVLFFLREEIADVGGAPASGRGTQLGRARRAHLALTIDPSSVEVSIELPRDAKGDLHALRASLSNPALQKELRVALEALPEQFAMAIGAGGRPAKQSDLFEGLSVLTSLKQLRDHTKAALWIGWSIPREVAIVHSLLLDEQLEDAIVALGPAFTLMVRAPDREPLAIDVEPRSGRERRDARRANKRHVSAESKRPRGPESDAEVRPRKPDGRTKKARDAGQASRPLLRATLRDGPRIPTSRAARLESGRKQPIAAQARGGRPALRGSFSAGFDPQAPVEKGARVRVLTGPFAGKVGFVQDLDGKGRARVMLGLLATRVDVNNLVACAEGRERPALMSSHRRPLPAR